MKVIPFDPSEGPYQNFNVNLGSFVCDIDTAWNEREGSWYFDFASSISGSNLSVRLVESTPLLGIQSRMGADGDFRVIRVTKSCAEGITFDNLGTDWVLVWGTEDEWEEYDAGMES